MQLNNESLQNTNIQIWLKFVLIDFKFSFHYCYVHLNLVPVQCCYYTTIIIPSDYQTMIIPSVQLSSQFGTLCNYFSPSCQSDRFQLGIPADFYRSKAQTPSSFSSLSSYSPVQKQRPSADQLLRSRADGDLLLAALRQFLYRGGIENSGLRKETSQSRPLKTGRTQDPLTSVDGTCSRVEHEDRLLLACK